MKVALLTHLASSVLRGGPRIQLEQTAIELKRRGVDVLQITGENQIAQGDVDLVHIFGAGMGTYHIARALHLQSIPMVLSPIYITRRSPLQVRTVRRADRVMRRLFPGFWTDYGMIADMCSWSRICAPNTDAEGEIFRKAFDVPVDRIMKIPNGVEERFLSTSPDLFVKTYGIKDFVLNVGHIGPGRKNVGRLIEALEGVDAPAVIIGRIEDTHEAREIVARAKANSRLLILDHIEHGSKLLESAYKAARLFVLPSLFETPGIAALEAALSGAGVVITPHGGTKEYFGEFATYIDPYSVDAIRKGITQGLEAGAAEGLADHIATKYLWQHVPDRTLRVYQRALES
jgi:glycosyltransferase involved in cell wall biosynthesis